MIDLQDLRNRPDVYKTVLKNKNIDLDVDEFLKIDEERKQLIPVVEEMRKKQNEVSKEMPKLKGKEKEKILKEMKILSDDLKKKQEVLKEVEEKWNDMQLKLPSIPLDTVPVGKDDSENVEIKKEGEPKTFDFDVVDHTDLGEKLDIIDIPRGVKIAGARSYFLKGNGARLEHALLRFAMDHLAAKGWTVFSPPVMVGWDCLMGTGFFPGAEEQTYETDDNYLIGTSEVSVCSYHKGEILDLKGLPKRYCGISPCFRREAGTYGKDTKGLYRVHQFMKVEQVVLCEANQEVALEIFEEIRNNAEEVLQALDLPYRVVNVCTGDMGQGKVFMQDIETWMPSREAYCETHSCSYLGDFQSRRLNIRYEEDGKKKFVHTLNNTCIATPRILIPILETYQNKDGSVTVPEVLRPYMGGQAML
ncbi:serine--tRNA ligase [Candidatus Peribacteria bacterium]|jgi:seryl-tRNA synthetase|nr:serine--tRNA ligase [Candidatus Peribacteria bacterium]MBT4021404.1 serine--tRNA ligase [Candidatus Peribacteria bacterium]MBT4240420.1 serine--tRNA ligase [Candidatus Peribacteria bacterium]MBT4474502.1 serine--tRNA ligase [Candidatus Peribacteria bacterium]